MRITLEATSEEMAYLEGNATNLPELLTLSLLSVGVCVTEVALKTAAPPPPGDFDWLFEETDKLEREMEKLRSVGQASMDCDECGGNGSVNAGSLGGCCPTCDGSGTVDAPFSEPLGLPNVAGFRNTLRAAEAQRRLGAPVDMRALSDQLKALTATCKSEAVKLLAEPAAPKRRLRGEGRRSHRSLPAPSASSDAALDALEDGGDDGE